MLTVRKTKLSTTYWVVFLDLVSCMHKMWMSCLRVWSRICLCIVACKGSGRWRWRFWIWNRMLKMLAFHWLCWGRGALRRSIAKGDFGSPKGKGTCRSDLCGQHTKGEAREATPQPGEKIAIAQRRGWSVSRCYLRIWALPGILSHKLHKFVSGLFCKKM